MTGDGERTFQRIVARLDYPMYVVTAAHGGERGGCLVGFASQCSIHPPRFVVWISKRNHTFGIARAAGVLAVHPLAPSDRALAERFGHLTGDDVDKLDAVAWHAGPDGVPLLDDAAAWFVGRVIDHLDTGDHLGFLLEPVAASLHEPPGLTYQDVKDIEPGHEP